MIVLKLLYKKGGRVEIYIVGKRPLHGLWAG